ncbi:MAG TPA: hypothetical protein VFJ47_06335, partial [Terriglobales bacterium]|nr:hypothetical protein [Terriglobales bacterium]
TPNFKGPKVVLADGFEASYLSDLSEDRNLVGTSHDIFIGKVLSEVSSEGWYTPQGSPKSGHIGSAENRP